MPSVTGPALGATILGTTALAGAGISAFGANSAANTQATAEQNAAQIQQQMYQQTAGNLAPYNQFGQSAGSQLNGMSPFNFNPTQAQLEQTPGYQFNLSQGLKSTQNSYAAQGLGSSGAALKGAASYASGLADTTYQNQFSNALNSYNENLNKLQGQANLGENAAAMTGNYGTQTAANVGQTAVGAANASAAGTIGVANAANSGISGLTNAYLYNSFFNGNNNASLYNTTGNATTATGTQADGSYVPLYGGS